MLAAQCVCGILQAEHSVIRQTVTTLAHLLNTPRWQEPGPRLAQLKAQVQHLRVFERLSHGPKDRHLWQPLWGRSDEADLLLGSIEHTHERNADLLWHALTLIQALENGEAEAAPELELTLRRHRLGLLKQIDLEEHDLMRLAHHLLSEEEWAGVASLVSSVHSPHGPEATTAHGLSGLHDDEALQRLAASGPLHQQGLAPLSLDALSD